MFCLLLSLHNSGTQRRLLLQNPKNYKNISYLKFQKKGAILQKNLSRRQLHKNKTINGKGFLDKKNRKKILKKNRYNKTIILRKTSQKKTTMEVTICNREIFSKSKYRSTCTNTIIGIIFFLFPPTFKRHF